MQWGGDGNAKGQTSKLFCLQDACVNCNVFTAPIALNGPCIMAHHYSGETHRAMVQVDCSLAPRELDER